MQVYSKTDARQNFAALFNAVRYAGQVIGIGRGKIRIGGKILPEVLMVKMPTPEDMDRFRSSSLGLHEEMKKWMLEKIANEFGMEEEVAE